MSSSSINMMENTSDISHNDVTNLTMQEHGSVDVPQDDALGVASSVMAMTISLPSSATQTQHLKSNQQQHGQSQSQCNNININTNNNSRLKLPVMAELFESEDEILRPEDEDNSDDDNSEVESFTLDEETILDSSKFDTSKFLLPEAADLHLDDASEFDPDSRAKLEALLEAAAVTSSVSCALDEAAAALAKMRINASSLSLNNSNNSTLTTTAIQHKSQSQSDQHNLSLINDCNNSNTKLSLTDNVEGDNSSILFTEKFNVNELTEDGESFLSLACSSGRYDLAEQLLKVARVNVEDRGLKDTTPLIDAASVGNYEICKLLLSHGADVNAQTSQGNTPLIYASAGGHDDVVRLLLAHGANVEDTNENGHNAIMEAASANFVSIAKILVEHGANINTHSNEFKESALTLSAYKGHVEMVRFLLESGADQEHKTDEMHTALMESCMDNKLETARLLLDSGAQVNMPADSFESPLTLAACGGHVELAMLLLERGANIEEVNDEGYTPLMEAAREGHEEMVALLLSQGADINAQTEETQETALSLSACGGFIDCVDFLIKAGADMELGANTPMAEASQEGHLELVKYLINVGANVNAKTSSGDTPLTYACENGHTSVAEVLLDAGAILEHEADGGRTALHKAARAGHVCTVQFLLSRGADVNKTTSTNDHTAMSLACSAGHLAVVELLLASGADPTHRLKDNSTMLIEAAKGGHTTIVQLLIDYPTSLIESAPIDLLTEENSNISSDPTTTTTTPSTNTRISLANIRQKSNSETCETKIKSCAATSTTSGTTQQAKSIPKSSKDHVKSNKDNIAHQNCSSTSNSKLSDSIESYVQLSKGRTGNKILERSLSDSGTSLFSSSDPSTFSNVAAAAVGELERVQAQWQQQLLQCYQASLSASQGTNTNSATTFPADSSTLANFASSVPSCLDISKLQKHFKLGENNSSFQLPDSLSHDSNVNASCLQNMPITSLNNESPLTLPNLMTSNSMASFTASMSSASNMTYSASSLTTPPANRNRLRSNSKSKVSALKQHLHQQQHHSAKPSNLTQSSITTDDIEKMNLKNALNLEQQGLEQNSSSIATAVNQTQSLLQQQQQMILSELKQNPATLQILQAAASNIKLDTTLPFLLPRFLDSASSNTSTSSLTTTSLTTTLTNTEGQAQQPTSTTSSAQEFKKLSALVDKRLEKGVKPSKSTAKGLLNQLHHKLSQQNTSTTTNTSLDQQLNNDMMETSTTSLLQSLTSEQLKLLKSHIHAVSASTQTQTDAPSAIQQLWTTDNANSSLPSLSDTNVNCTPSYCNTDENNLAMFSLKAMEAPAFPIPLSLSSVTETKQSNTAKTITSKTATTIKQTVFSKQTGSDKATSLPPVDVQAQPIVTNTVCPMIDTANFVSPSSLPNNIFTNTNTLTSSSAFEPISFPTVPTSSALTVGSNLVQQHQQQANNFSAMFSSNLTFPNLPSITDLTTSTSRLAVTSSTATNDGNVQTNDNTKIIVNKTKPDVKSKSKSAKSVTSRTSSSSTPTANNISIPSPPPWFPPIDLDSQTDSNHDTALSVGCAGGHEELVTLLLNRGADIEHRDKKGFTPLMLASTAGHSNVVDVLLNNGADMEAQSERTKDTALSLACSSGRFEVVEMLLSRGANKEHRNVSDYTPLSLAASGGYVNIIKLLLQNGAEINSRTGSKLGISPLMLASMNGHQAACKLLLDMGSDINAQIETNRNTALTLACFQGRCEVVGLLLDRKANVEHRAKTGLTPLSEAASGGYVEVGRVLLDKGADVNAPPVPSSRDTSLHFSCDKGHYRFVELLIQRGAAIDVKNKKGQSPLWLACNGGHLDCIQYLVNAGCDIDSQDNRKTSCLMAAFRKGHIKVVKWLVKHVNQFPADQELERFIALMTDKDVIKKSNQCAEIIRQAKDRQAAEANKNASILLEEIDQERTREESKKAAAARRRERKRVKKKEKQEVNVKVAPKLTDGKDDKKNNALKGGKDLKVKQPEEEDVDDFDEDDESNDEEEDEADVDILTSPIRVPQVSYNKELKNKPTNQQPIKGSNQIHESPQKLPSSTPQSPQQQSSASSKNKNPHPVEPIEKEDKPHSQQQKSATTKRKENMNPNHQVSRTSVKKRDESASETSSTISDISSTRTDPSVKSLNMTISGNDFTSKTRSSKHSVDANMNAKKANHSNSTLTTLSIDPKDVNGNSQNVISQSKSPVSVSSSSVKGQSTSSTSPPSNSSNQTATNAQSKKGPKREEGWKEVVRKSKKVSVPANAISRVIGRGGCNINAIREISGAHIEVEKQKGQGDRQVIIKGSADATRNAQQLITALAKETDKDLNEIIKSLGLTRPPSVTEEPVITVTSIASRSSTALPSKSASTATMSSTLRQISTSASAGILKSSSTSTVSSTSLPSSTFVNRSVVGPVRTAPPPNSLPFVNKSSGWNVNKSNVTSPTQSTHAVTSTKSTVSYTMAVSSAKGKNTKTTSTISTSVSPISKVICSSEVKPPGTQMRIQSAAQPFNQGALTRISGPSNSNNTAKVPNAKQPFINSNVHVQQAVSAQQQQSIPNQSQATIITSSVTSEAFSRDKTTSTPTSAATPEYTPFNNLFSKVAQPTVWGQSKEKPNFASVAASGLTTVSQSQSTNITVSPSSAFTHNSEQELSIDASKAPGYRGNLHISPSSTSMSSHSSSSNLGPIGSGPRSAPCTPPLVSSNLSSNSSTKMTPPPQQSLSTTTSPPPSMTSIHQTQKNLDAQSNLFSLSNMQMNGPNLTSPSSVSNGSNMHMNMSPQSSKMSSSSSSSSPYNMPKSRLYSNNTNTYNNQQQHVQMPLINHTQSNAEQSNFSSNASQSSLNPNAPDFSAPTRNNAQQHQMTHGAARMTSSNLSNASQPIPSQHLMQDQMRAAILAVSCNLQLQTLQSQQQARMQQQFANQSMHSNHNRVASNEFPLNAPATPEALRFLQDAINSVNASQNASISQFNVMPSGFVQQQQQQQQQQQPNQQRNIQQQQQIAISQLASSLADLDERKVPQPIGTERAQKKNPGFVSPRTIGGTSLDPSHSLWSQPNDISVESNEWSMLNQPVQQPSQQQPQSHINDNFLPNSLQRYITDESHHFDQSYQSSHNSIGNTMNYHQMNVQQLPVMNGALPAFSHQLYQSSSVGMNSTSNTSDVAADYWSAKMPSLPNTGLGNGGLPNSSSQQNNVDQKLSWSSWNHHAT